MRLEEVQTGPGKPVALNHHSKENTIVGVV
jgi:hypothetical protein